MDSPSIIRIDVEIGPTLRTAMDVLDLAIELAESLPEYDSARSELLDRALGLSKMVQDQLYSPS